MSDVPETAAALIAAVNVTPEGEPTKNAADEAAVAATGEGSVDDAVDATIDDLSEPDAPAPDVSEPDVSEPEADGFASLGLSEPILRALHDKGYLTPTPIQAQAIPIVLMGQDVLGCAQTGTGKTAGFTLPMLDILSGSRSRARMPRSLILEPTRELALQVAENFVLYGKYLKLNHALLIGGESMSEQKAVMAKGVDVLIATPGRLIDLFERGGLLLTDVRVLVIDEADRMLDMGFIPDIERIVAMLPRKRQTLFFSATMAPEIRRLADAFLNSPKEITVSKPASVATTITAGLALVAEHDKRDALLKLILSEDVQNALIFCNRKRDVDILNKSLAKHHLAAGALHGDLAQSVRFATLEKFKAGEIRLLVCSDVAARGIDIGGLSHVFNYDVPHHAEDYVHRIGRTGRARREGRAYTIATPEDAQAVQAIETLVGAPIPRIVIDGLEVVAWAEDDGRRGRGRSGRPGRGAGRGAPAAARPAAKPREDAARPERAARSPWVEPTGQPTRVEDAAQPDRSAREAQPAREERAARPPRDVKLHTPKREEPAPREERGEYRRRDRERASDLGPNVVGFGSDVPAFMLIRKRGPLATLAEQDGPEEEDLAFGEDRRGDDAELAA